MANTADTTKDGNVINVTYSGSGDDWNYSDDGGYSVMKIRAIIWLPSGANDILVINNEGIDGASIVHWKASAITDTKQMAFGGDGVRFKPHIDLTDCTYADLTITKIIFILA